jgi:methanogenic corrinoid protein MtbC1
MEGAARYHSLQQELEYPGAEVVDLGKKVDGSIETVVKAMQTRDAGLVFLAELLMARRG